MEQLSAQLRDDTSNERVQKICELQRREAQIDAFFSSYESSTAEEAEALTATEEQIVRTLERCSQYIVSTEQTLEMRSSGTGGGLSGEGGLDAVTDQLSFKAKEMNKSASTAEALDAERSRLQRDLQKIDQLEGKITQVGELNQ